MRALASFKRELWLQCACVAEVLTPCLLCCALPWSVLQLLQEAQNKLRISLRKDYYKVNPRSFARWVSPISCLSSQQMSAKFS